LQITGKLSEKLVCEPHYRIVIFHYKMAATRSADQFDNIFMELLSENGLSEQEISFLKITLASF
jgi:hypothetical protein